MFDALNHCATATLHFFLLPLRDWQVDSTNCSRNTRGRETHDHRNELLFLLDVLLRQDGINRDEYAQLNNMLPKSLDEEDESTKDEVESTTMEEDEGRLKKLIRSTVEYLIQYDKKELLELIKEFRKDVGEDVLNTVLEFEELVDVYLL